MDTRSYDVFMPAGVTLDDIFRLARQLSALDKLKLIERLMPELDAALSSTADASPSDSRALDEQYQRAYEQAREDVSELEALLPHLPLPTEQWE